MEACAGLPVLKMTLLLLLSAVLPRSFAGDVVLSGTGAICSDDGLGMLAVSKVTASVLCCCDADDRVATL